MNRKDIVDLVTSSFKEISSDQDDKNKPPLDELNESTYLIGRRSFLDSISLVSLLVEVEQKLNDDFGLSITIADERAMSQEKSPFRTMGTLVDYIQLLVNERQIE